VVDGTRHIAGVLQRGRTRWMRLGLLAGVCLLLGYATLLPAQAADMSIKIDIKPGSHPNAVNLCANGVLPVGLFGSSTFDPTQIDLSTTCLVWKQVSGCLPGSYALDDHISLASMYGYGALDDTILHFDRQSTGTPPSTFRQNRVLCVRGSLLDGTTFEGCSGIVVINDDC